MITDYTRFEILKRDSFICQYCGRHGPDVILQVDHIIPKSKGGTDDWENLKTSCLNCNMGKSNIPLSTQGISPKTICELATLAGITPSWASRLISKDMAARGKIGGYSRASKYSSDQLTKQARLGFMRRFWPDDDSLSLEEATRRANCALKAHMAALSRKSAIARKGR